MISVIVPVLNEAETIRRIVELVRRSPGVGEILVVDDGSIDDTVEIAQDAGAQVITSTLLGKGASMQDGLRVAAHDLIVYLDGDLSGLDPDLISKLTEPLRQDKADFVKARFSRAAGRVTALTARPLLLMFFPELASIEQPLGGIIAARRSTLARLRFETDYGVDVGLLLDAASSGARIAQIDIGHIEHDSHPLEVLGDMATQVARVILDRAARQARLKISQVREVEEIERHTQAELSVVLQKIGSVDRIALLEMDGVLVQGRFIAHLAQRTNKVRELAPLLESPDLSAEERTLQIGRLFEGVQAETFKQTALALPLAPGAADVVVSLRKKGYRVGIVTESFYISSEIVRRRVFADFSVANRMRFRQGKASGNVILSPAMVHPSGCPVHPRCKLNVMLHLCDSMNVPASRVLAIGDGEGDLCLLRGAGASIAFGPKTEEASRAAQHTIRGPLSDVLGVI